MNAIEQEQNPHPDDETRGEFFSEEHRAAHLAGLAAEKDGYEKRAANWRAQGLDEKADGYIDRAAQCQAEIDRINDQVDEDAPASGRRARRR